MTRNECDESKMGFLTKYIGYAKMGNGSVYLKIRVVMSKLLYIFSGNWERKVSSSSLYQKAEKGEMKMKKFSWREGKCKLFTGTHDSSFST